MIKCLKLFFNLAFAVLSCVFVGYPSCWVCDILLVVFLVHYNSAFDDFVMVFWILVSLFVDSGFLRKESWEVELAVL